jgi:hypothetical protein
VLSAGLARAVAAEGAAPPAVSPYGAVALDGLPAVATVEGRIGALTAGATALVTRPGGETDRDGVRQCVRVAGYLRLEDRTWLVVTLLAIPDAGSFQELSLRPAVRKERP